VRSAEVEAADDQRTARRARWRRRGRHFAFIDRCRGRDLNERERHTFASLLIDSGANAKAVQEFMGHSKIQTTLDTYGHLLPAPTTRVRERMDAYLLDATAGSIEAPAEASEDAA
jgi:integrase